MNYVIKQKWIEALRSGEYQQTCGALKTDTGFCCLGVLCDIHAKETKQTWSEPANDDPTAYKYLGKHGFLPNPVVNWAELGDNDPDIQILEDGDEVRFTSLSEQNDSGAGFNKIADLIEKYL